jgi:hypothetical protein
MDLSDLTTKQLDSLAKRAKTTLGYIQQIRYGNRRPSPELARDIEVAAQDMGIHLTRAELLYSQPKARRIAKNRRPPAA